MDQVRVLKRENLEALCEATGKFWVEKETRSRVWVGHDDGQEIVFALFPCFPQQGDTWVALHVLRLIDTGYHALDDRPELAERFLPLLNGPRLERGRGGTWRPSADNFFVEV